MSFDLQLQPRTRRKNSGDFRQLFSSAGFQGCLARIKPNARHVDDQTSAGLSSLKNSVELFYKLLTLADLFQSGLFSRLLGSFDFSSSPALGFQALLFLRLGALLLGVSCAFRCSGALIGLAGFLLPLESDQASILHNLHSSARRS